MQQPLNFESFSQPVGLREAMRFASSLGNARAHKIILTVAAVFAGFCFFFSLLVWLATGPEGLLVVFMVGIVPTILIIGAAYAVLKNVTRSLRLTRFAQANGFTFTLDQPVSAYPGLVFSIGHSPQYITVVKGTYKGLPFEFGNFYCTEGSGKNSKRRAFGVIEVKLTRRLPHILLDATANNSFGFSNLPRFIGSQHLSLEGNFNDYFNLYVPDGYERDALYIITPELMALLIDQGANFDIEIVDDRLYVYSSHDFTLGRRETIEQIFKLIEVLGAEVLENTSRYADATVGDRQINLVAETGRRLRRFTRWYVVLFWILWGIFMVFIASLYV